MDQFNNTATTYNGTVHFSSSDAKAVLPADATLANGVGTFSVMFATPGADAVTAKDTVTTSISAAATTTVASGAATHFVVNGLATNEIAGGTLVFTVAALDQFYNSAPSYNGTVHFSSSDAKAVLPANATLTNGVGVFSVILETAGSQSVTATDTLTGGINGARSTLVASSIASHFFVTGLPAGVTAGTAYTFTVTAQDQFNNTASSYTGTTIFSSSDVQAILPAAGTLTNGIGTFTAIFKTAGGQTIVAEDSVAGLGVAGSATVTVNPAATTHLGVIAPAAATAGKAFSFTVQALDAFNNIATGYTGTVHFTTSDAGAGAAVAQDYTMVPSDDGVHVFTGAATLVSAGSQILTATDAANPAVTGTSGVIAVGPGVLSHFILAAPASTIAGNPFVMQVTAVDQFNNRATNFTGTAVFSSGDSQATLPASTTLTAGFGAFVVDLKTAGNQTLTVTDFATAVNNIATVFVGVVALGRIAVVTPAAAVAGVAFNFTVSAKDASGNSLPNYVGTVHFTSSDHSALLPNDYTFTATDGGVHVFSAALQTVGTQSLSATDAGTNNTFASQPVLVNAQGEHFSIIAPTTASDLSSATFTVEAVDASNNLTAAYAGTIHFTSSDAAAVLPADATLSGGVGVFSATLNTPGNQDVIATDTVASNVSGTSNTITVAPCAGDAFCRHSAGHCRGRITGVRHRYGPGRHQSRCHGLQGHGPFRIVGQYSDSAGRLHIHAHGRRRACLCCDVENGCLFRRNLDRDRHFSGQPYRQHAGDHRLRGASGFFRHHCQSDQRHRRQLGKHHGDCL